MALGQQLKMHFIEPLARHSGHATVSTCLQPYRLARLGRTSCSDWIRKLGLIGLKFSHDDLPGCHIFPFVQAPSWCMATVQLQDSSTSAQISSWISCILSPLSRVIPGYWVATGPACSPATDRPPDRLCPPLPSGSDYNACRKTLMLNESL